jgi:regulator of replication initiation timing
MSEEIERIRQETEAVKDIPWNAVMPANDCLTLLAEIDRLRKRVADLERIEERRADYEQEQRERSE